LENSYLPALQKLMGEKMSLELISSIIAFNYLENSEVTTSNALLLMLIQ